MNKPSVARGLAAPNGFSVVRRIKGSDDAIIAGTALLLAVLVAGVWYILATVKKGNAGVLMQGVFYCITIGVPLLVFAALVALIVYRRKYGAVSLLLDSQNVKLGERINGWIEIGSALRDFDAIQVNLSCLRVLTSNKGDAVVLWKHEETIGRDSLEMQPGRTLIPVSLSLPTAGTPNENHFFGGDVRWVLAAEAMPRKGARFVCQFPLPVVR